MGYSNRDLFRVFLLLCALNLPILARLYWSSSEAAGEAAEARASRLRREKDRIVWHLLDSERERRLPVSSVWELKGL